MSFWLRILACILFLGFASAAARLPAEELESFMAITRTLGKTDWSPSNAINFPCDWLVEADDKEIKCDCSFQNNTVCHVTAIPLKRENLTGSLPRELAGLPYLQIIDLTRNYLKGTIPPEWGSMQALTKM